ncbi:MAG: hypothetical protein AB7F75_01970 [Planctomycetota bacterium]
MTHPTFEITAYLRGELKGEARRIVSDHLIDCRECRAEFLTLKKTREILGHLPELEVPAGFADGVMEACQELALEETRADLALEHPPRHLVSWVAGAVLLAFALSVGIVLFNQGQEATRMAQMEKPLNIDPPAPKHRSEENNYLPLETTGPEESQEEAEPNGSGEFFVEIEEAEILSFDEVEPEAPPAPPPQEWEPWVLPPRLVPVIPPWPEPVPSDSRVSEDVGLYGKAKPAPLEKDNFWILPLVGQDGSLPESFQSPSGAFAAVNVPRILERRLAEFPTSPCGRAVGATLGKLLEQEMRGGLGDNLYHHALLTYNLSQFQAPSLRRQLDICIRYLVKRQNKDGGFGFVEGAPSNAVVSGWAALALMGARDRGVEGTANPLVRVRNFFNRLTDSRSGLCGLYARGDGRLPALCSAFSHLVVMDHRTKVSGEADDKRIWDMALADIRIQEKQVTRVVDLDAMLAYRILAEKMGRVELWRETTANLLIAMSQHLPQGRFEAWSPLARGIWVELLR